MSDNARPRGACIGFGKSRPKHGYSNPNRCWRRSASNGPASPDGRPPVFMDCGSPVRGRSVRRVEGQQLGGLEAGRTAGTFVCLVVASLPIRLGPLPLTVDLAPLRRFKNPRFVGHRLNAGRGTRRFCRSSWANHSHLSRAHDPGSHLPLLPPPDEAVPHNPVVPFSLSALQSHNHQQQKLAAPAVREPGRRGPRAIE